MDDSECRHNASVGAPDPGQAARPEQEGLEGEQVRCMDGCGQVFASRDDLLRAKGLDIPYPEELECLDEYEGDCTGGVEYRMALSGTGKQYPRCDGHWEKRLNKQEEINRRYAPFSDVPPDFDPTYADERWSEDY